ncbi:hypothetical protein [Nitrospirillum iridis]|uniref:Uncharacterized protein n=1 Tax=Nitrospirillum iridis TaxID=765888 RepID=A0A7X0EGD1_9PROT|nr:hypothetical protein [Nitrospirillum iridis]MBB6253996.1 hypothetical protein [Nitrospirillum iridis]
MSGGYSNLNFMVFIILAVGGVFLVLSGRRILARIRETERRIAATVDEKNEVAADLRVARQQEEQLAKALEEGEEALREIARRTDEVQHRMAVLRQTAPRPLNLVALEWAPGDHLFEAHLRTTVAPRQVGRPQGGMAEAGLIHGYAPTEADFRAMVTNRLSAGAGYVISSVLPIALVEDEASPAGAAMATPPGEDEALVDLIAADTGAGDSGPGDSSQAEPGLADSPVGPKPLPVRPPAMTPAPAGRRLSLSPAPAIGG